MVRSPTHRASRQFTTLLISALTAAGLSGCLVTTGSQPAPDSGINYRMARHAEVEALRTYQDCHEEALALDRLGRSQASSAKFAASAAVAEGCEADLGMAASALPVDIRMRNTALAVQNYVRAGDVDSGRRMLAAFDGAFPGQDLYLPDGSSFIRTMDLLVGDHDSTDLGPYSRVNGSDEVKSELRRLVYWREN